MKYFSLIIVLLIALVSTTNAKEVPKDYRAERMYELCKGEVQGQDKGMQSMVCTFRIQGVVSLMIENCLSINQGFKPMQLFASEIPPSKGAARQAFKNFMQDNPDKWRLPWHIAVSMALSESFPCKR